MTGDRSRPEAFHRFRWEDLEGECDPGCVGPEFEGAVRSILDPASAVRTIHWGRNYIYEAEMATPEGPLRVVVKQFRNHGLRRRLDRRLRGSKATRSWRIAQALIAAGLATPRPILLAESTEPEGNSYFVAELLRPAYEVRQFFRRLTGDPEYEGFPEVERGPFLARLGALARRIHDAGIIYRDLSLGNILAHPKDDGDLELHLVDFNRAKIRPRLGVWKRSRDICRLPVVERADREAYLEGYWGAVPPRWSPKWWIFTGSVRGYILKHQIKGALRRKGPTVTPPAGGKHHAHIPAADENASIRDRAVWDRLSDQPHQHASKWQKTLIRLADAPDHLADFAVILRAAPRVHRRYRELKRDLYRDPVPFDGLGVAVRPCPENPEAHFEALTGLGLRYALLRLHPWEDDHDAEEALARRMHEAGMDIVFALPQVRALVTDLPRWRRKVEELADRFRPYGRRFIIGHAINRSKWGVWTSREYAALYRTASEILRRDPDVEILGPGVIDFEYQATLAALERRRIGAPFDAVASLLYVDRRGAPENPQMGLDTVGKITLLRAICETTRWGGPRSWITEVNWPLWEGPHSPAGRSVAVSEEAQADYLVRYDVLALTTGLVERVYWWRLAARGYGLSVLEPGGELRLRPAYFALKTLADQLRGAVSTGPIDSPEGTFLFRFDLPDGGTRIVAWAMEPGAPADLPAAPHAAVDRNGEPLDVSGAVRVTLGPTPVYFHLEER